MLFKKRKDNWPLYAHRKAIHIYSDAQFIHFKMEFWTEQNII